MLPEEISGHAGRRPFAREAGWFALFVALSVVMTWPWVLHLGDAVLERSDTYLHSWILAWNFHQLFHDPFNYFHANIFFPMRYSLALSEHMFGIFLPLFWLPLLGLSPIAVCSVTALAGFALTGYAAFRLGRTLLGSEAAGLVAGIGYAFLPYRFAHIGHLDFIWGGWLVLLLEALVLFMRSRSWRSAAWLSAMVFLNGASVVYWLLLPLPAFAATFVLLLVAGRGFSDRRIWIRGGAALAAAAVALIPFLLPYVRLERRYGLRRPAEENLVYSARLTEWAVGSQRMKLYGGPSKFRPDSEERALFPGVALLVLAACAALLPDRAPARAGTEPGAPAPPSGLVLTVLDIAAAASLISLYVRKVYGTGVPEGGTAAEIPILALLLGIRVWLRLPSLLGGDRLGGLRDILRHLPRPEVGVAWIWLVLGFLGSLGMNTPYYRLLYAAFYPLHGLRVPARAGFIAGLGLVVLAAWGAAKILERVPARRRGLLLCAIGAVLLFDLRAAPLDFPLAETEVPEVYRILKETPMRGGLVELPYEFTHLNAIYTWRSTVHWKPLVNANSSFEPGPAKTLRKLVSSNPVPVEETLTFLESLPVSYLVVHEHLLAAQGQAAVSDFVESAAREGRLRLVARTTGGGHSDALFALTRVEPGSAAP